MTSPAKAKKRQSLEDRIKRYLVGDVSLAEATRHFVSSLKASERNEMLYRLAYNRVRMTLRGQTRETEVSVFGSSREGRSLEATATSLAQFCEERFALPDRFVVWLDATVADHRERADWQRSLAAGCLADAERHETAIAMIEEAGVSCLRDLLPE